MKKCVVNFNGCKNCTLIRDSQILYPDENGYNQEWRDSWIQKKIQECEFAIDI